MRVAILNRPPVPMGGDQVALRCLISALQKRGVKVEHIWGPGLSEHLKGSDLAHAFHVNFNFCRENFTAIKAVGIPYVVTPVWYPEYSEMTQREQRHAVVGARMILPFSKSEFDDIHGGLGMAFPFRVIPNGTDTTFHSDGTEERAGVCSSDWGGTKGCQTLAIACHNLGLPFVRFSHVPHERMPEEYRSFRVYASASQSDRMSLSVGEALCSGCRVLSSSANRGNEWYPGLKIVPSGADVEEWASRINDAYRATDWDWTPNIAARTLTWDRMAEQTTEVYRGALA